MCLRVCVQAIAISSRRVPRTQQTEGDFGKSKIRFRLLDHAAERFKRGAMRIH